MVKFKKDAQSTIEYILLFAGVVALLIVFLSPSGSLHNMISNTLTNSLNQIQTMTDGTDFATGDYEPPCVSTGCAQSSTVNCGLPYSDNCGNSCGTGNFCPGTGNCIGGSCNYGGYNPPNCGSLLKAACMSEFPEYCIWRIEQDPNCHAMNEGCVDNSATVDCDLFGNGCCVKLIGGATAGSCLPCVGLGGGGGGYLQ